MHAVPLPEGGEPIDLWIADGRLHQEPVGGADDLPALAAPTAIVAPGHRVL